MMWAIQAILLVGLIGFGYTLMLISLQSLKCKELAEKMANAKALTKDSNYMEVFDENDNSTGC